MGGHRRHHADAVGAHRRRDQADRRGAGLSPADPPEGLRLVQAFIDGAEAPSPVAELFGTTVTDASVGSVTLTSRPGPQAMSRRGGVHGGVLATFLDTAVVLAALTAVDKVVAYSTVELSVHYLRPVPPDLDTLVTRGELLRAGRRLSFARAQVEDHAGQVYATATGTVAVA